MDRHSKTSVSLTGKEFALFEVLYARQGTMVPNQTLLDEMYGKHSQPEKKIIDVLICKMRGKFAAAGLGRDVIQTSWGKGKTIPEKIEITPASTAPLSSADAARPAYRLTVHLLSSMQVGLILGPELPFAHPRPARLRAIKAAP